MPSISFFSHLAFVALAISGTLASPIAAPVAVPEANPEFATLQRRGDFLYRFYTTGTCDHNAPSDSTYPPNNNGPLSGFQGDCISAPLGTNWNRVEIDQNLSGHIYGLQTFADVGCRGIVSGWQKNMNCFSPAANWVAIGSFKIT